jgi:hypothetical protein
MHANPSEPYVKGQVKAQAIRLLTDGLFSRVWKPIAALSRMSLRTEGFKTLVDGARYSKWGSFL